MPLLEKLLSYRVFADEGGKMNRSHRCCGRPLLVPQFTLAADTTWHPSSFTLAATPERGRELFDYFVQAARQQHHEVATGQFGADMKVSPTNDGPVTLATNLSLASSTEILFNSPWRNRLEYR